MPTDETPFVAYIREWMWRQRPPMTYPSQFAQFLGITKQAVYNWWDGKTPAAQALILIADKTGLSLRELLMLCGYPVPNSLVDKDELMNRLNQSGDRAFTAGEIEQIIRELQAR